MSEKITFGELIESIAAETDHSKQFTHDFLKDFVNIINGGLEEDGKVNIAGFGKFDLQKVDEREGYNPQTEEKMTIPAHNKVVFKPYKDLRELVNAPYAHMESTLLEETPENDEQESSGEIPDSSVNDQPADTKQSEPNLNSGTTSEEGTEQDDFIPTAPPTAHAEETLSNEESERDKPKATDNQQDTSEDYENGDVVEFDVDFSSDADEDILDIFLGTTEHSGQQQEPHSSETEIDQTDEKDLEENETENAPDEAEEESSVPSPEETLAEEVEKLKETAEELKESTDEEEHLPSDKATSTPKNIRNNRTSASPYVAAALILILAVMGGIWYFSEISQNSETLMASEQTISGNTSAQNQKQQVPASKEPNDQQNNTTTTGSSSMQQNQSQTTSQQPKAQTTTPSQKEDISVNIEEGQTLWSLAEERYGNPRLWPWIYGHDGSIDDPDVIYAGSSLSVPLPSGPQNTLNARDSVGVAKGFLATYKWYKSNEIGQAKNHLWAAKSYYNDLQQLADIPIDKTDLSFANTAR